MPFVTVPCAIPRAQGGGQVGFNECRGIWAPTDSRVPGWCQAGTVHSQEPMCRQAVAAQPTAPRNRIRLILTLWTAFDMEAAGVIQNSGPVEQPECIAKANMFISTRRPLGSQA